MPAVNLGRGTRNSGRPGGWRYQHCFFVATFPSPSHLDVPTLLLRWHNHTSSGSLFSIVSSIFSSFPHVTRRPSRATSTYRLVVSVEVFVAPPSPVPSWRPRSSILSILSSLFSSFLRGNS